MGNRSVFCWHEQEDFRKVETCHFNCGSESQEIVVKFVRRDDAGRNERFGSSLHVCRLSSGVLSFKY